MMGGLSIWHWLIFLAIVALVFGGRGKLSGIMGDAAKGIRAFRDGLKGDEETTASPSTGKATDPVVHIGDVKVRDADELKR